jgi:hypothetical protein
MRRLILLTALVCSACSGNSTSPSATPQVNFTGVYNGTYQIVTCTDGSLTGFCTSAGFVPGTRLPISFSIGQNQNSVTGTLMLGSISGTFQGTATGAGLTGTAAMNSLTLSGISVLTNVTSWSSTLTGNSMSGNFNVGFTVAVTGVTQPATVAASIVSLAR